MQTRIRPPKFVNAILLATLLPFAVAHNPFQGFPPAQPTPPAVPEVSPPPLSPDSPVLPPPEGINMGVITPMGPAPKPDAPIPELPELASNRFIVQLPVIPSAQPPLLPHPARYAYEHPEPDFTPAPEAAFTLLAVTHASPSFVALRDNNTGRTLILKLGDTLPDGSTLTAITNGGVTITSTDAEPSTLSLNRSASQ